jgi:putative inorganic carbon (HCO3(-)) transporter
MLTSVVRASVLGLGVGLAYLGIRRYRVLLLGLPLAMIVVLMLGVAGGSSFASFSSSNSFQQRQLGWGENFNQFARHPLGIGIGTTGAAADKAAQLTTANNAYNPDNYYFKTAYELGVLGLWMFILLLIGAFTCTRRSASEANPRDGPLLDGVAAMVLAAAAASTVANYFDAFPLDIEFWLLLAVAATIGAGTAGGRASRARREAAALVR